MLRWLRFFERRRDAEGPFPLNAPLESLRYAVIDTELTSLNTRSNRLLSIGAVGMDGTRIRLNRQLYCVVNPGVPVPEAGVPIHGLRPCDVETGLAPGKALADLRAFVEGAVLVGHFFQIDRSVLRKELGSTGHRLENPAIDTARVHRWIVRHSGYTDDLAHRLEQVDLRSLAAAYHLESHEAHHALDDAFLTARLWQKLIHILHAMHIRDLDGLLRIAGV